MTTEGLQRDEESDVLVVGAGAGGAAVSLVLAEAGVKVTCLEQGDWIDRNKLPKAHADWEARGRRFWNPDPTLRRWPADYDVRSVGGTNVKPWLYNAVGGSTIGFGGVYWRLLPSDFATWSLDGFGVDWPISYEDLAPYYHRNEQVIGSSGLAGDPTEPERDELPTPPVHMGKIGGMWIEGFRKLGWYWWPQECAIATRDYGDGRGECLSRGFCRFGCPSKALSTVDVSYWPRALRAGVQLRTGARVREVMTGADGLATGVRYYDDSGTLHEARARVVVLACGGLGTPRLLLMSRSEAFPDGLANSSGLVGKNLMVHVLSLAVGRFNQSVEGDYGAWGGSVSSRQFYETDPSRGYLRGFTLGARRGLAPLDTALQIAPWGADHHAVMERHLNHEGVVAICGDDAPEEVNRVELDWQHPDPWGLPALRLYYRLSENSLRLGEDAIQRAEELCRAAGASEVRNTGLEPVSGWHLMGTARMGADRKTSVTDSDSRCHDVANLFIADASAMPTGGAVNPTNTIQALALRVGDRILALRSELGLS